ncbi:hypothetical protein B0H11DRAFT_1164129 [Mycena galericulata]|nr:hypothetical protein B0H11DRAFT_1164129 [Mycena galericulata]
MGSLVSAGAGYTIPIRYSDKSTQSFTWIERDLGPSVVALFKNYDSADVAKAALVVGKVLPVVSAILTYPEFAEKISAAIGKPVAFEAIDTHGLEELDVMFDYQTFRTGLAEWLAPLSGV